MSVQGHSQSLAVFPFVSALRFATRSLVRPASAGTSTGTPSEEGLTTDAYEAWCWLTKNGAKAGNIVVIGHSLGRLLWLSSLYIDLTN